MTRYVQHKSCFKDPVLSIARCDLLAAIFVMLKILMRLLFVARIELFNNNGRLAPVKRKTTRGAQSIMANTGPLSICKQVIREELTQRDSTD